MKKLMVAGAIAMLAGTANSWAVTNTFQVTQFRGVLTAADGTTRKMSEDELSTNRIIMVVSDDAHEMAISEVSGTTTNVLMDQRRVAFTKGGKFNSAMRGSFIPFGPFVPVFLGDLQFTGKLGSASGTNTPKKVSASIIGVWTENTDTTFKGNLQGQAE